MHFLPHSTTPTEATDPNPAARRQITPPASKAPAPAISPARSALAIAALTTFVLLGAGPEAQAQLHWELDANGGCTTGAATFSCGSLGHYSFSPTAFPPKRSPECTVSRLGGGTFEPLEYPQEPTASTLHLPCDHGACLDSDDGLVGSLDAMIIDWRNEHGWSVAGVIDRLAGSDARLGMAAFDDSVLAPALSTAVTDAHVLEQLCKIVEMPADERPLLVNMSFGRPVRGNWQTECDGSSRSKILCEVDLAIRELDGSGVHLIAAAGHHDRELFPAASEATWSAGAVDLASLDRSKVLPASHTPVETDLLVPGYGVFLGSSLGNPGTWSAPPGSSYSAAVASGWTLDSLLSDVGADAFLRLSRGQRIGPMHLGADRWALGLSPGLYMPGSISSTAETLMETALGHHPTQCSNFVPMTTRELTLTGGTVNLPDLTLDDVRGDMTIPCPESFPCVPCHDMPDGQPLGGGPGRTEKNLAHKALPNPEAEAMVGERIDLDLSGSEGFDLRSYDLLGVYLRTGGQDYRFAQSNKADLLSALSGGQAEMLTITNPPASVRTGMAYLVFHLRVKDLPIVTTDLFSSEGLGGAGRSTKGLAATSDGDPEIVQRVPITVHGH